MKTKAEMKKITKKAKMNDLIKKYPEVTEILMGYGLNCVGCHFSSHDTLETGLKVHGLDHEIDLVLRDINKVVKERKDR